MDIWQKHHKMKHIHFVCRGGTNSRSKDLFKKKPQLMDFLSKATYHVIATVVFQDLRLTFR